MRHTGSLTATVARRRFAARARRTLRAALPLAALVAVVCLLAPAGSLALSEGRVYEMVTPLYKAGYGGYLTAASPSGETVAYTSVGAFAGLPYPSTGNYYVAQRQEGKEWVTTPIQPPFPGSAVRDFSSSFSAALGILQSGETVPEIEHFIHPLGAPDSRQNWLSYGGIKPVDHAEEGVSGDLCHVVIAGAPLAGAGEEDTQASDLSLGCHGGQPSFVLVGVKNERAPDGSLEPISVPCGARLLGAPLPSSELELEASVQRTYFNAVSADGSAIFFSANVEGDGGNCAQVSGASPAGVRQLFVRVGGQRTLEVSRPLDVSKPFGGCGDAGVPGEVPGEVPCPGATERPSAYFRGASEDGSRVFFMTRASLLPEDTDERQDLYMATIGCPEAEPECSASAREVRSLVRVSRPVTEGASAQVLGVVAVSQDGAGIYFVAHGVLSATSNDQGEDPVQGADNLYAYDANTDTIRFIADLCTGAVASGGHEDSRCPRGLGGPRSDKELLWGDIPLAHVSDDGRFLVFSTYARLISHGTETDTDSAADLYRYDESTGTLNRISLGEAGADGNGNGSFDATISSSNSIGFNWFNFTQRDLGTRAISNDGSMIVFTSAEPLSPDAINGLQNVYIWRKEPGRSEGRVSMISSGNALTDDQTPVITPSGRDVFFATTAGLASQDTEHDTDIYDARVGGGFPPVEAERQQCSSDACQGPLTNPAPLLVPGSFSQAPGGNFEQRASIPAKGKAKPKKSRKKRRKKKAKGAGRGRDRTVLSREAR